MWALLLACDAHGLPAAAERLIALAVERRGSITTREAAEALALPALPPNPEGKKLTPS